MESQHKGLAMPSFDNVFIISLEKLLNQTFKQPVVVVVILFPTEYKQRRTEYMSNIIATSKP